MLVLTFLIILLAFLLLDAVIKAYHHSLALDNAVLDDQTLAYHLDWEVISEQKLLTYLFVKKVNAVVRYQNLAGVSYEQASEAIEYLLAHPNLLPEIPQKRRPALPLANDEGVRDLLELGKLEEAVGLYQDLLDVDPFTAQQVIDRMRREHYVKTIDDVDIQRLITLDDEPQAVTMLQERYGLTQSEAIQAIDTIRDSD
jgi:tetratricopeptide (TPR) repeat protein